MAKVIGNLRRNKFNPTSNYIRGFLSRQMMNLMQREYLPVFNDIVSPFQSNIRFHIVQGVDSGNLITALAPIEGIGVNNPSPSVQDTADLYNYLNDGSMVRWYRWPRGGYRRRATSASSIRTQAASYDRDRAIFVSRGIDSVVEPREFTEIVDDALKDRFTMTIDRAVRLIAN